jgi:hypothetical protein
MISAVTWRISTAIALLILTGIGVMAGSFLPVLMTPQGDKPLWDLFAIHPILGILGIIILLTLIVLIMSNAVRLLNLNLNTILIRNTPLTPVVSLLGLGSKDPEAETTRLNLVLAGLLLGALLVLGGLTQILNQEIYTGDGYGVLLFFAAVPLAVTALTCHPRISEGLVLRAPTLHSRFYFEVRQGRLIGARPSIEPPSLKTSPVIAPTAIQYYEQPGLFSIGRGEANDLVLFDENPHEVLDTHACLYFPDLRPTLRIYGPVRINDELYEQPADYALEHQFKFQIGQTVIRFFMEPLS